MRDRTSENLKLGIFTIIGLSIFIASVYFIGNRQNMFGNNSHIISVFKDVNGLQPGNNVRYAGVNIGTVKDITILNDTSIAVDMLVEEKALNLIRKNATAAISSDGLVGSMVVNIIPNEELVNSKVAPGDTLTSVSQVATADMIATLNKTNQNAARLTEDLLKITNAINNGEGTVGALINDREMAGNFKNTVVNLRKSSESAASTIDRLNQLISKIDYDNSAASVLFSDTVAAQNIAQVIEDLQVSSEEIKQMSISLNEYSNEIKEANGTLNYLVKDTSFVKHLEATVENAEAASKKFDQNMDALQHSILFRWYFKRLERQKQKEGKK